MSRRRVHYLPETVKDVYSDLMHSHVINLETSDSSKVT